MLAWMRAIETVRDGDGKPLIMMPTEGPVSDYRGAATVLGAQAPTRAITAPLPPSLGRLRDRTLDFRHPNRKKPVACDADLYKQRNFTERMFGKVLFTIEGQLRVPLLLPWRICVC